MTRFPLPSTLALYTSMGLLSARLQEMMGQGLPVATHSSTTVWWTETVTFWGPAMILGLWRGLGPAPSQEKENTAIQHFLYKMMDHCSPLCSHNLVNVISLPSVTVSVASLLFKWLPMLVATHRYSPASSSCTLWIWRTPLGKTVILRTSKGQTWFKLGFNLGAATSLQIS